MKFAGYFGRDTRNKTLCIQGFFLYIFKENPCLWTILRKNERADFHDFFLGKSRHKTRNTLEHFRDLGFIKDYSGTFPGSSDEHLESVIEFSIFWIRGFSNIMEKVMNGFSWNCHTSGTTQEEIIKTVSRLTRLFHGLLTRCVGVSLSNISVKRKNRFSWNFQDRTVLTRGTSWNISGWCV